MITEVKTGEKTTSDLICPLMSGQIVPVQGPPGGFVTPGQTMLAPSVVTCAREKCQWWSGFDGQCTIQAIAEGISDVANGVSSVRDVLEPPTGDSPIMRIADSLEKIVKHQQKER